MASVDLVTQFDVPAPVDPAVKSPRGGNQASKSAGPQSAYQKQLSHTLDTGRSRHKQRPAAAEESQESPPDRPPHLGRARVPSKKAPAAGETTPSNGEPAEPTDAQIEDAAVDPILFPVAAATSAVEPAVPAIMPAGLKQLLDDADASASVPARAEMPPVLPAVDEPLTPPAGFFVDSKFVASTVEAAASNATAEPLSSEHAPPPHPDSASPTSPPSNAAAPLNHQTPPDGAESTPVPGSVAPTSSAEPADVAPLRKAVAPRETIQPAARAHQPSDPPPVPPIPSVAAAPSTSQRSSEAAPPGSPVSDNSSASASGAPPNARPAAKTPNPAAAAPQIEPLQHAQSAADPTPAAATEGAPRNAEIGDRHPPAPAESAPEDPTHGAATDIDAQTPASPRNPQEPAPSARSDAPPPRESLTRPGVDVTNDPAEPSDDVGSLENKAAPTPAPHAKVSAEHPAAGRRLDVTHPDFVDRLVGAIASPDSAGRALRIRLHPPELGTLQIEVSLRNGIVAARLDVQTAAAQQVILDSLPMLRETLSHHATQIDRIDVQISPALREEPPENHSDTSRRGSSDRQSRDDSAGDDEYQRDDEAAPPAIEQRARNRRGHADRLDVEI